MKKVSNMKKFKESDNPYTLQFSFVPPKLIERTLVTSEIIDNFTRKVPTYRGMFITGVRGSGKTVMLGHIRNKIAELDDWITIDLNPESNLIDSLARGLYLIPAIKALFVKAKLDFSVLGIGLHIENAELMASNEEDALKLMLQTLKASGIKVLVTIDEITYSKDVALFSHALSSYSNSDYDIYVLMTGLAENIKNIKNKKSLTFLYRAKVKELDMLNITSIREDYQKTLELDRDWAEELAYETRGYSLAFQAAGYFYWNAICRYDNYGDIDRTEIRSELYTALSELAYDKIWEELSPTDLKIINSMLQIKQFEDKEYIKVEQIRNSLNMSSDVFTKYRTRLIDSGIVDASQYGHLRFKLPLFEQYIKDRGLFE